MIHKKEDIYRSIGRILSCILITPLMLGAGPASIEGINIIQQKHDPFGFPRPGRNQKNVPVQTSFYIVIGPEKGAPQDSVLTDSVSMTLLPEGGEPLQIVKPGLVFAEGYRGKTRPAGGRGSKDAVALFVASETRLKSATTSYGQIIETTFKRSGQRFLSDSKEPDLGRAGRCVSPIP